MPDMQRMGGPSGYMRAMSLAEAFNVPLSSHLCHEMSVSLLATSPGNVTLEYSPWMEPLYSERLALDAQGRAVVPKTLGWGFNFDANAIDRFRIA